MNETILKIIRITVFTFCILAFFIVPCAQIVKYHKIETTGTRLLFHVEGFDPYDPFRGRYVMIRLSPHSIPLERLQDGKETQKLDRYRGSDSNPLWVGIKPGADGFAQIETATFKTPKSLNDPNLTYWKIKSYYSSRDWNVELKDAIYDSLEIQYPITRFYMNERLAPTAETEIRANQGKITAVVYVKDGIGVLEDILVDGVPLAKVSKETLAAKKEKQKQEQKQKQKQEQKKGVTP